MVTVFTADCAAVIVDRAVGEGDLLALAGSRPSKSPSGSKLQLPSCRNVSEPLATPETSAWLTTVPSMSLVATVPVTAVFSSVDFASSAAAGASLTPLTVMVTVFAADCAFSLSTAL